MSDVGKVHVDSMVQKASGSDWVGLSRRKAFHAVRRDQESRSGLGGSGLVRMAPWRVVTS